MLRMVLFPAPFSPIKPTTSPSPTLRSTPLSARLAPNDLTMPVACSRGSGRGVMSYLLEGGGPENRGAVVVLVQRTDAVEVAVALCGEIGLGELEPVGLGHTRPDGLEIFDRIAGELQIEVV